MHLQVSGSNKEPVVQFRTSLHSQVQLTGFHVFPRFSHLACSLMSVHSQRQRIGSYLCLSGMQCLSWTVHLQLQLVWFSILAMKHFVSEVSVGSIHTMAVTGISRVCLSAGVQVVMAEGLALQDPLHLFTSTWLGYNCCSWCIFTGDRIGTTTFLGLHSVDVIVLLGSTNPSLSPLQVVAWKCTLPKFTSTSLVLSCLS